jgi:hypothetical protein
MAARSSLRASDADRDAVAERLRHAAVEGRIEPDELEDRLHVALRARTHGDLRRLLSDLPAKPTGWHTAFAIAVRVAMVLAVVIVALTVAAVMAVWWVLRMLVRVALWGRRSCAAHVGTRRLAGSR